MPQVSFGTILRNERERQGYDLSSVARRLHIRPDILRAIEASNFDSMPPRGYARNMIHAYARFLGLNPTEITRFYLDEAYAYQVKCARSETAYNGSEASSDPSQTGSIRRVAAAPQQQESGIERRSYVKEALSTPGRTLYVDDRNGSRHGGNDKERLYPGERGHRTTHSAVPSTQYTNFYAGPQAAGGILSKLPIIIACAIILILVVVLVVFFLNSRNDTGGLPNVPVTGVSEGQDSTSAAPVAPTSSVFKFELSDPDNQDAWVEIYENGAQQPSVAGLASGIDQKSYNVSGTLRFDTPAPGAVKVYIDNAEQQLTDDDGDGVWSLTVDFQEILAKWYIDNPSSPKPAADAGQAAPATGGSADTAAGTATTPATTASTVTSGA